MSRLMGGKGGRLRDRFRRSAQFIQRIYSGCCLLARAYCFFAHNEFFKIIPSPRMKKSSPPGPGSQLTAGAEMTSAQPLIIIIH